MSVDTQPAREFTVGPVELRLDRFLAGLDLGLTRSRLHSLIVDGMVRLNGQAAKPSQKVRHGDRVTLTVPRPKPIGLVPQWMPLTLIHQDADIVVVDKPAGLSVHPGPGHPDQTLVNALLALCPDIEGVGGEIRPGIVHRLDKDTSGLMVVAKNHDAHTGLSAAIKAREVTKGYLALATGVILPDERLIDEPIARDPHNRKRMAVVPGGRESRTKIRLLDRFERFSLLEVYLETGRTHQIRVHMAHLGYPLAGDRVYGRGTAGLSRHFLHAHHLGFRHPATGTPMEFRSDLPADLAGFLDELRARRPN